MSKLEEKIEEARGGNVCINKLGEFWDCFPCGFFKTDLKGNLTYMNKYLAKLMSEQYREASRDSKTLGHFIDFAVEESLSRRRSFCVEGKRFEDSKGGRIFLSLRTVALNHEGEVAINSVPSEEREVVGVVEDVSERIHLEESLKKKISELSIICEVGNVLRSTLNLEEILEIILIGVTAGQGLGFNRAFLLLFNEKENVLEGKIAIGPSNPEEAQRIWEELSHRKQSLEDVLHSYKDALGKKDILVNHIVKKLRIPCSDRKNFLVQSLQQRKARPVIKGETDSEANRSIFEMLATDILAVAPLVSKDKMIGVLLADNSINKKPIHTEDIELMEILAHHASTVIESSKLYQQLAEQVKQLEEANKKIAENSRRFLKAQKLSVLGEITSQVAHELRNPMTIIGGFARSLLKKKEIKDSDYEYLSIIAEETERVEKVLDNVLNFTKPDKANSERVDLSHIVDQTLEMMEGEMDTAKISIIKYHHPGLPEITLNPDQIRHALLNIFRNAVWAMPQGGILSITTKRKENLAKIEIKDTGFGIPKEHLPGIFDAFFTTKPDSCGLGLTISSEIIKNHGGSIGAESEKGKGTIFSVILPLDRDQPEGTLNP